MQKMINHLKDKLQVTVDDRGMLLDDVNHSDFKNLMLSESTKITKKYHKDSFEYFSGSSKWRQLNAEMLVTCIGTLSW